MIGVLAAAPRTRRVLERKLANTLRDLGQVFFFTVAGSSCT